MPRESVSTAPPVTYLIQDVDGNPVPEGTVVEPVDALVHVGWDKRQPYVQVGVVCGDSQTWTHNMNREQINALIRLLRKARDQAHGRDE